ncbi:hypothetical protein [Bradyrhizobium sp.]|uniref:hypothetical protein n=1 Tax=Bradyrhizobium sp. TaxID=376 RepID=UPI003C209BD2
MSDQQPEPIGGESGSLDAGVSHPSSEAVTASAAATSEAAVVPVSEPSMPEPSMSEPSMEAVASETPKVEAPKVEAVKAEASPQAAQPEAAGEKISPTPGKVIVMSRGDRAWSDHGVHAESEAAGQQSVFGMRRIAAIAAVVALAIAAGALGGAFATATLMHGGSDTASNGSPTSLEASLSRIDTDIQALKTGLDHTSKLGLSQFNKTSERLDKLERAQADPAAKIAKLSETVDKLRAAPAAAPAAAAAAPAASSAAKETTGSIAPAQQASATTAVPKTEAKTEAKVDTKTEVGRLPTLEDWVLRDVGYGGALIGGRRGTYEVYAGDTIPGLGRVDAIRRQDGRWVVVTSRGLIVAR